MLHNLQIQNFIHREIVWGNDPKIDDAFPFRVFSKIISLKCLIGNWINKYQSDPIEGDKSQRPAKYTGF